MMKKNLISIIITACMLVGAMPMSVLAAEPQVVDLIHSSGTTLRDGISVSTFRARNTGTKEAPVRTEVKKGDTDSSGKAIWYNASYGKPDVAPFDGSISGTKNQTIVDYAYEIYYQLDLGASRNISQIIYTVKCDAETSIARNNDKQNFMITLSNDPEFKDNPSDPFDVYVAYYEGNENAADPQNVHTANLSDIPAYRYLRISAPNNEFMEGEARELCIAELEVYGYIDGEAELTADATATTEGSAVVFDLNAMCNLKSVVLNSTKSNVVVSGKVNDGDSYVELATLPSGTTVSIPETAADYRYVKVSASSTLSADEIDIYGYNLFDEVAYLDITDDNSTVYAKAKYGDDKLLILTEFDDQGRCVQTKSALGTEMITMTVVEGHTYKAFLWNSFTDRKPVTKSVKLEK